MQLLLQDQADLIVKASRRTVQPAIDALTQSGMTEAQVVLERWQSKELWRSETSGLFVFAEEIDRDTIRIFDVADGQEIATVADDEFDQLKPNSGVRRLIGAALVRFQLTDPDPVVRATALDAIARNAEEGQLDILREVMTQEADPALIVRMTRLERLLTIEFGETDDERIAAINGFAGDLGVDVRAVLNPLVATRVLARDAPDYLPKTGDRDIQPGERGLTIEAAYQLAVDAGLSAPVMTRQERRDILVANLSDGSVGGLPAGRLDNEEDRDAAYQALITQGLASESVAPIRLGEIAFYYRYVERFVAAPLPVALAAEAVLEDIEAKVAFAGFADLALDGVSLASIYFLAAIGLAITFGVMGVINMAHGEFIMMGAYTGYVVQLFIPDHTLSIIVAIPLAFAVTFGAGIAMERLVVRWLYHRPLETLLATFGVSIALQQIAKNIFGTQARPLTAPDWLDGSWALNDVISISYIRIAIFVLALLFLALFLFVMNRTRLGLEVRAVTQNPRMAASMGINPDKINMLTFGFGSGIAGIAGVAIGLYAKVTSEMGQDYIVQSFMTVVVGGVGNIWGTLLGASLVGTMQKGIEWLNPSNTLAAQTYMILFIILFIQFRPRGIIALKGRAAEA
ncbi:MAG: urea ABC transporter permease subunit UrtB [Pseudomonadota bacterium]